MKEGDEQILKQLYNGNHLNKQELERAKEIVNILQFELSGRKLSR